MKKITVVAFFVLNVFTLLGQEFSSPTRTEIKHDASEQASKSGFFQTAHPANFPTGANGWWHLLDVRHDNPQNNYAMQFAGSFFDQDLYFRKINNNATESWQKVLMTNANGNLGVGVVMPTSKLTVNGGENNRAIEVVGGNYYGSSASYSFPALSFYSTINAVKSAVPTSEIRFVDRPGTYGYAPNVRTSDIEFYTSRNWDGSVYTHVPSLTMTIKSNQDGGYVGIGTAVPKEKLSVNGKIRAQEIKVEADNGTNWPDYVFDPSYQLPALPELEKFIRDHRHLPGIPSAKQVKENGIALGENQAALLKKIEEQALYIIQQEKRMEALEKRIASLEKLITK
ncbi:hypothetical protein ACTJIJ_22425 [Niabella sp. 22666]|uniref:hypothetical protein n=1 Tax=Niabella sp. 22666 TaxID=3453954 RepID=UPI003F878DBE